MSGAQRYDGKLYRALNPVWAADPISGEGAAKYGGRFNAIGTSALYCSLSPHTALREANQVGDLQPITVVSYEAAIDCVFDGRDEDLLVQYGMSPSSLADRGWRDAMRRANSAPTQRFASSIASAGYNALLVPSYARGNTANDLNLVLFVWGDQPPSVLSLIDDEGRLSPALT